MSTIIGDVREREVSELDHRAVERLEASLAQPPETFFFDCSFCGAERRIYVNDPGVLSFRDYTCADVRRRCRTPATPKSTRPPPLFRPGSLVFAARPNGEQGYWPGIIEDPPSSEERFLVLGKTPYRPRAWYVTFIYPQDANRRIWLGGFIAAKDVIPLEQPRSMLPNLGESTPMFTRSIEKAFHLVPKTLPERLSAASFNAYACFERRIQLSSPPEPYFKVPDAPAPRRKRSSADDVPASPAGPPKVQRRAEEGEEEEEPRGGERPGYLESLSYWIGSSTKEESSTDSEDS
ncbi:uncharacterized protein LOC100907138 [Galendromus occidentalis]|uniref:Uncharacterized protein LOC100907138 n=1 Tax=Galendromus occidentalis TaxID=34638 RepID=A0AAJ6VY20_9ACAR|nr:uncharacterized protein LOC100907138 [Galendromus occidentalis]